MSHQDYYVIAHSDSRTQDAPDRRQYPEQNYLQ